MFLLPTVFLRTSLCLCIFPFDLKCFMDNVHVLHCMPHASCMLTCAIASRRLVWSPGSSTWP